MSLAESARQIMAEHPSQLGWHRHQAGSCGGHHPVGPWAAGNAGLVYWQRPRDVFDATTYLLLDAAEDPVLWVAELVPPALCCSRRFFWANTRPALRAFGISPWSVSAPEPEAGVTVRLGGTASVAAGWPGGPTETCAGEPDPSVDSTGALGRTA
jgi:hypothetical protein